MNGLSTPLRMAPFCGGRAFLYGPMGRWGYLRAPGWRLLVSVSQGQPSASFLTHRDPSIWSNFLICQELSFTCHRRAFAFASIIVTSWVALPFYYLSWLCLAHRWRGSPRAGQLHQNFCPGQTSCHLICLDQGLSIRRAVVSSVVEGSRVAEGHRLFYYLPWLLLRIVGRGFLVCGSAHQILRSTDSLAPDRPFWMDGRSPRLSELI